MNNKTLHMVTFTLLVIGGLNWLLVGLLDFNLVTVIGSNLGSSEVVVEKGIYVLIGLSAIYELTMHKAMCKMCSSGTSTM